MWRRCGVLAAVRSAPCGGFASRAVAVLIQTDAILIISRFYIFVTAVL